MNRESERKRLVELVKSAPYGLQTLGEYFNTSYIENCIVAHLLDNGVIVPPFEIGAEVYAIINNMPFVPKDVYKCKVRWYAIGIDGIRPTVEVISDNVINGANLGVCPEDLFPTREEAEAKLQEGKQ